MTKRCPRCAVEKSTTDFGTSTNRTDGLRVYCTDCTRIIDREYYDKDREKAAAIKRRYGCAICGHTPEPDERSLAVDHDHSCCKGKENTCGRCTRGLLCGSCNKALGLLGDNLSTVLAAAEYLTKWSK